MEMLNAAWEQYCVWMVQLNIDAIFAIYFGFKLYKSLFCLQRHKGFLKEFVLQQLF